MTTPDSSPQYNDSEFRVLLIEDDDADLFLFEETVKQAFPQSHIQIARDGHEAIQLLDSCESLPDVIFLDINMPRMNGHEFLATYGETIANKAIPVYVLTSSIIKNGRDRVLFSPYPCIIKCCQKSAGFDQVIEAVDECLKQRKSFMVVADNGTSDKSHSKLNGH